MTSLPFAPPPSTWISLTDGTPVPVRDVWCVGRNYAAHAREMGSDPRSEPPCFFSKARTTVGGSGVVVYPPGTSALHHEVELVVVIGRRLRAATVEDAAAAVFGSAVGLDLTRRDLQDDAKRRRWPWDLAKSGFPGAATIGRVGLGLPDPSAALTLSVNGTTRQHGRLSDMIWSVPEVLARLSAWVVLEPGDVVFTGTPEGVGPLLPGDALEASVEGLPPLHVRVAPCEPALTG